MFKSMYDILNKKIDYCHEYKKIWEIIFNEKQYRIGSKSYSTIEMFDKYIVKWKFKGTKCSSNEVLLDLCIYNTPTGNGIESILPLIDFVTNIRAFINYEVEEYNKSIDETIRYNSRAPSRFQKIVPERVEINDKKLVDLIDYILHSLNYEIIKEDDYKCFIVKKDVDSEETVKVVEDENVSTSILKYNDYTIVADVEAKKIILNSLANYFEGIREDVNKIDSRLEKNISFALNNFNIRHNNVEGKNANDYVKSISSNEMIDLYDKTYFMLLLSFRLVAANDIKNIFEKIRKEHFNNK